MVSPHPDMYGNIRRGEQSSVRYLYRRCWYSRRGGDNVHELLACLCMAEGGRKLQRAAAARAALHALPFGALLSALCSRYRSQTSLRALPMIIGV